MKRRLIFALIVMGFASMASQIVIMRELLVVFYGNELSLSITLTSWLFWVSFGSLILGKNFAEKIRNKVCFFASIYLALSIILPLCIIGARFIPEILRLYTGEVVGVLPMLLSSAILLALPCIMSGFVFALASSISEISAEETGQIGYVYLFETIGASIGGLTASLVLIRFFDPFSIMLGIGLLNICAAICMTIDKKPFFYTTLIVGITFIFLLMTGQGSKINEYSLRRQWHPLNLVAHENSIYGNLAVTEMEKVYSLFTNGLYTFSSDDKPSSEVSAHFVLLQHPAPQDILLIGSSLDLIKEILRHPVRRIDYVEMDPAIVRIAKIWMPSRDVLADPRVNVITDMDGRLYVKRMTRKYDCVMMNLPGPHTAGLNRFYTEEFFREVDAVLKKGGVFSFKLESNPNYISPEQINLYLTIKKTLSAIFKYVKITPGETNFFLSSQEAGLLTLDQKILAQRLIDRKIDSVYTKDYYIIGSLSSERVLSFEEQLNSVEKDRPRPGSILSNEDFRPIAYYQDMVLWSTYFNPHLKKIFTGLDRKKVYGSISILYALLVLLVLVRARIRAVSGFPVLACLFTTGFAEIVFQLIILMSFQALYGYVYYELGIIMTSFMIGLIFGSYIVTRFMRLVKDTDLLFIKTQGAVLIYTLLLPVILWILANSNGRRGFWIGSNVVLPLMPAIAGFIGGVQFPLANHIYLKISEKKKGYAAGLTYGLDLLGATIGAVAVSLFLMPIIGIMASCLFVAGLNFIGLMLLLENRYLSNNT